MWTPCAEILHMPRSIGSGPAATATGGRCGGRYRYGAIRSASTAYATSCSSPPKAHSPSSTSPVVTSPAGRPTCKSRPKCGAYGRCSTPMCPTAWCFPAVTGVATRSTSPASWRVRSPTQRTPFVPCCAAACCPAVRPSRGADVAPCGRGAFPNCRIGCWAPCSHRAPRRTGMTEVLATLYATTPGTSLHLDGDALRIVHPDRPGRHLVPLVRPDHIVAWNGVDLSDDLIHRCAADGRSVTWLTRNGRFLARATGPQTRNPLLRLAQFRAYDNPERRLAIARAVVAGKLHNYRQLLLRSARGLTGTRQAELRDLGARHAQALTDLADAPSLSEVLGIEGNAARGYFQAMPTLAPSAVSGRTRRPPLAPVNCLLSFCYGMLRVAVHGALEQVGLDPFVGYLHGIRPGKPALALDLMEELRPLLVDRLV